MKKKILKEVSFCDRCEKESWLTYCVNCNKGFCYKCCEKEGKTYSHSVWFGGSGDGYYCRDCNNINAVNEKLLFNSYLLIEALKAEANAWNEDFKKRSENAENNLKILRAPK